MARANDKKGAPSAPDAPDDASEAQVAEAAPAAEAPSAPAPAPSARYRILKRVVLALPGLGVVVLREDAVVSADGYGERGMAAILEHARTERLPG